MRSPSAFGRIIIVVSILYILDWNLTVPDAAAAPPIKEDQLSGVTQNWDKVLPSAERFTVLQSFNNQAVRDNETGLVWEQSVDNGQRSWDNARSGCNLRTKGGRKGWRLPAVHELATLQDPNNPFGQPDLPPGHPFTGVLPTFYWTATTDANDPTKAWWVSFDDAGSTNPATGPKTDGFRMWCVRGPMNGDKY
jgi:hypothetical protein